MSFSFLHLGALSQIKITKKSQMKHLGLLFFFFFLLKQEKITIFLQVAAAEGDGFIKTNGVRFMLNGAPFYADGFNAYWLMTMASDQSHRNKVTLAFQQAIASSLRIGRTWAFSDGGSNPLQSSPGVYNENMFQGLDFVVSEAGKFGVKLMLSLVNNYNDYGGKSQYVQWAKEKGQQIPNDDGFFSNPVVKEFYKNHIKAVLTRRNTITGIAYKDDPTIMAWELMNEPRCPSDLSGATIRNWITEMASYLKSIDGNHLLEVGLEGFYGPFASNKNPNNMQVGTDFIANNQIPGIDFATVHSYPDQWLPHQDNRAQLEFFKQWVKDHIQDTEKVLRKPVLFAEFGKSWKDPGYVVNQRDELYYVVYSATYTSASKGGAAAGGLFWQQLVEGMDSYKDGYEIVLTEPSSTVNLITLQAKKLSILPRRSLKSRKLEKMKMRL